MPELTHSQKQIRKEKKKARQSEQKYEETKDTSWLTKRDTHNDKVSGLESGIAVNQENKVKKISIIHKTDDQLMDEYIKLNNVEREQRGKEHLEKVEKENEKVNEMKKRREEIIKQMKIKKEQNEKSIQERNNMGKQIEEEYKKNKKDFIDSRVSDLGISVSEAHKIFVKEQQISNEYNNFKANIVEYMVSIGIDKGTAESDIEEAYKIEKDKDSDIEESFHSFKKSFIKNVEFLGFRDHSIKVMIKLGGVPEKSIEEFDKNYEEYLLSHSDKTKEEVYGGFSKDFTAKLEFLGFKYQTIMYLIKEKNMDQEQAIKEFEQILIKMKDEDSSGLTEVTGL